MIMFFNIVRSFSFRLLQNFTILNRQFGEVVSLMFVVKAKSDRSIPYNSRRNITSSLVPASDFFLFNFVYRVKRLDRNTVRVPSLSLGACFNVIPYFGQCADVIQSVLYRVLQTNQVPESSHLDSVTVLVSVSRNHITK